MSKYEYIQYMLTDFKIEVKSKFHELPRKLYSYIE
jgi:hypothetical protein